MSIVEYAAARILSPLSALLKKPLSLVDSQSPEARQAFSVRSPIPRVSIVSNDGIYADFDVDEQTYLESVRSGADTDAKEKKIPVELTVSGQKDHRYRGTIYSFDNRISTSSGTIRARAKFDNRDGKLVPGMFVVVKIGGGGEDEVVTVPVGAIGTDQTKKFVLLANAENSVVYREVTLGPEVTGERVVFTFQKK